MCCLFQLSDSGGPGDSGGGGGGNNVGNGGGGNSLTRGGSTRGSLRKVRVGRVVGGKLGWYWYGLILRCGEKGGGVGLTGGEMCCVFTIQVIKAIFFVCIYGMDRIVIVVTSLLERERCWEPYPSILISREGDPILIPPFSSCFGNGSLSESDENPP